MASSAYMLGRRQYLKGGTRPQAVLWSDNPGTASNGSYVPNGDEGQDFIILSDHNRSEINMAQQRIETRQRMINGTMRSYWIADKLNISLSWSRLPSRSFSSSPDFDPDTGKLLVTPDASYTADGAAGGADLLSWYEDHPGPFYVFLSYDKLIVNGVENYNKLQTYNQVLQMYFSSFDYSIEKRSGVTGPNSGFDFWNVSLMLEEV